jgi:hypothetical protein
VPYAGFGGDYQGIPILTSGGATPPFPKLAKWTGFTSAQNFTPTYTFPASPVTYTMETMPNGNYQLWVQVLKALGDPNNPADVETYTSPTFTIARP